ncbi:DUF6272 family protein [Bradyrhizobium sp. YCK136]|uniref:DUF6272 family protein n=1 Tax=Bradyrhizobium sp. YCK136 TaxID=3351346 RepID=UPI0037C5167C
MTIHHSLIRDKAAEYRLGYFLDPDRNVIFSAERPDLVNGEHLNKALASIELKLRRMGASVRAIQAVKDIIIELACNTLMHGAGDQSRPELLVVSHYDGHIGVWLFGQGRRSQIQRLHRIIKAIDSMAKPPKHRDILFERRNRDLLRTNSSPASKSYGSGAGMLTIAALSSMPIRFASSTSDDKSFMLLSTI